MHSKVAVGGLWQLEDQASEEVAGGLGQARQWLEEKAVPHLYADKPGTITGKQERLHNPGFQHGKREPQNLWL